MQFSKFAKRYTEHSGIVQLMEDLGEAMSGSGNMLMLGGGNPAHIPVMEAFFQERMQRLVQDPAEFSHFIGNYDPPKGEPRFIEALAELFNREYGWGIGPENIVLTAGSQSAFFLLFNMLAGEFPDGSFKRILLPLAPEYIGYGDVGLKDGYFVANRPDIETLPDHTFKYHVDFGALEIDESIGALCVSDASLYWDRHIILCWSLSKLGLPAARTGIIIAKEAVGEAVAGMNGIFNLAMGSLGPTLALDLVRSGEVIRLSDTIIKPYYRRKAEFAIDCFRKQLDGVDYYIHKAEGAIFLWLWFPGLPISSEELYQRLKAKGVLVLSGHYFFPGIEGDWRHRDECIRVSYAMPDEVVSEGIRMIADEVKKAVSSK
ncbi:MAG: pyridoxal phosphate-dependent aminotransferase [Gammaproteobacteria bacterium]